MRTFFLCQIHRTLVTLLPDHWASESVTQALLTEFEHNSSSNFCLFLLTILF